MHFSKRVLLFLTLLAVLLPGAVFGQEGVIAQAYATVNVRRGPGTQYDIIGQLTSGNEVQITGRSDEESNWLRINFENTEGWVAYFTVSVLGNAEQLPVVSPRAATQEVAARFTATPGIVRASGSTFVTAYRAVNVRSGPGTEYVSIGTLTAGSTADVTGKSSDSEWLRIDFDGGHGWVAFFVVTLTGVIGEIEQVNVAPDAATESPVVTATVVTRYNVNLREQPLLSSPIMLLIPFGMSLKADARSDENDTWLRVTFEGRTGWVIRSLVDARNNLDVLAIED